MLRPCSKRNVCEGSTAVSPPPLRPACEKRASGRRTSPLFRLNSEARRRCYQAASRRRFAVAKPSPERRGADNNSARCAPRNVAREEKAKTAKATGGLVSVFEKTKRISGVSWDHAGSHRELDADTDRRSHDRRGNLVVYADYGCRNQVRWYRKSLRGDPMAGRPPQRQRLQVPGSGPRQSRLRVRGCNGQPRRARQALTG